MWNNGDMEQAGLNIGTEEIKKCPSDFEGYRNWVKDNMEEISMLMRNPFGDDYRRCKDIAEAMIESETKTKHEQLAARKNDELLGRAGELVKQLEDVYKNTYSVENRVAVLEAMSALEWMGRQESVNYENSRFERRLRNLLNDLDGSVNNDWRLVSEIINNKYIGENMVKILRWQFEDEFEGNLGRKPQLQEIYAGVNEALARKADVDPDSGAAGLKKAMELKLAE